jgi:hypothetical protein
MVSVNTFSELEEQFLRPVVTKRHIKQEEIPLEQMQTWRWKDGKLFNSFFEIFGTRTSFEAEPNRTEPSTWDQPIYRQGKGTLALFIDEHKNLLINGLFEPGNASRGYQNQGLVLSTSCKFSPGNLEKQRAAGHIPPLSHLIDHPEAKKHFTHEAPGDGGRADKQNQHYLIELPRTILEAAVHALPAPQSDFFVLLPLSVFKECYEHALVNEHLRDLASMLLFIR